MFLGRVELGCLTLGLSYLYSLFALNRVLSWANTTLPIQVDRGSSVHGSQKDHPDYLLMTTLGKLIQNIPITYPP